MASSRNLVERFRREARAVAALNHPHIVTLYSFEETDRLHFLTMPVSLLLEIAEAVAGALVVAHFKVSRIVI